jgi:WD40 repeat protein
LITSSNDIVQKDIETGVFQRTFRAHSSLIFTFFVTNDSRMISSAYDDMIIVWNLETGSILKRIWLKSSETFVRFLYFKDDQVFAGGLDEKLRQVEIISGRVLKTICNVLCLITDL